MSNMGQTGCDYCIYLCSNRASAPKLLSSLPADQELTIDMLAHAVQSQKRENKMKTSTKDELKGSAHEVEGAIKATTGKVTGNSKFEAEGHLEKKGGKLQKKIGEVEKVIDK